MRKSKLFLVLPIIIGSSSLFACSNSNEGIVLRVLNMDDYIYVNEDEPSTPPEDASLPDLVNQFEKFAEEQGYKNVRVVYDTTDTNETLYSELQTGKSRYDVICPSEYMIQKLIMNDLISPLDFSLIPNYEKYASALIKGRLDEIEVKKKVYDENSGKYINTTAYVRDYAVGYMWGTLGMIINPEYSEFDVDMDTVINDFQSWSSLWDEKYFGTASIKNSIRDTYVVGVIETYKNELISLLEKHIDKSTGELINTDEYNHELSEILNRCDEDQVYEVKKTLDFLKDNIFGLEVDSGKQDIITGKIGINLAWSGDAVYSMDQAEDEEQVSEPFELYYSVPEIGSNIWFDGWVMPKCERSKEQYELAHMFLNFLCDPFNASQNMDYTGYTSFIGGDSVLELVRDWYDVRSEFVDEDNGVGYLDVPINPEWEKVDLSYFFNGTLEEYENGVDTVFYSDCYLPYREEGNISVGRQFFCQYPDERTIARCAVMRDFGDNYKYVVTMWEDFKSDPLPTWAIVLFAFLLMFGGMCVVHFAYSKYIKKKNRKKRKLENN